jgi:hypothetical protein
MRIAVGRQHAVFEVVEQCSIRNAQHLRKRGSGRSETGILAESLDVAQAQHEAAAGFMSDDGMIGTVGPERCMRVITELLLREDRQIMVCGDRGHRGIIRTGLHKHLHNAEERRETGLQGRVRAQLFRYSRHRLRLCRNLGSTAGSAGANWRPGISRALIRFQRPSGEVPSPVRPVGYQPVHVDLADVGDGHLVAREVA